MSHHIKETFKKWLKEVIATNGSNGRFDAGNKQGSYDSSREVVIIYPPRKEYSRVEIEDTFCNEKEFDKLVDGMLS